MKKFLTVLLALSVIFTYSFSAIGTAFAATPTDEDAGKYILSEKDVEKKINDAYNLALKKLATEKDAALAILFPDEKTTKSVTINPGNGDVTIEVTKSAVESVYDAEIYDKAVKEAEGKKVAQLKAMEDSIKAVNTNYNGYFTTDTTQGNDAQAWANAGYAQFDAKWREMNTYLPTDVSAYATSDYEALFTTASGSKSNEVAEAVFDEVKNAALKHIKAINLSVYSKEKKDGAKQSNYDLALADVNKAIDAIDKIKITAATAWSADTNTALENIKKIYKPAENQGNPAGYLYEGNDTDPIYTGLDKIPTIADEPTEAQKLEWAKAKVLYEILDQKLNTELQAMKDDKNDFIMKETLKGSKADQKKIAEAKEDLAAAEKAAAAATETIKYLVENTTDYNDLIDPVAKFTDSKVDAARWAYTDGSSDDNILNDTVLADKVKYTMDEFVAVSAHVVELKEKAELLKKEQYIDGATIIAIEEALADAIDETYRGNVKATINAPTALSILYKRQVRLIGATGKDVEVSGKTYPAVEAWTDNMDTYYDAKYYADVRKAVSETEEAIKAAASVTDADAAFIAGYEKFQAVPTIRDKEIVQATKEFKTLLADYTKDIEKYIEYKKGLIKETDYSWTPATMRDNLAKKFSKAYTIDELKASLAAAKAEVDNLKTKAALKAEADALNKRMDEISKVTVADKERVATLSDDVAAHNKYCDLIGDITNKVIVRASLTNAVKSIKADEAKAVKDQYSAIYKDNKVMTNEADAVKALRTAYDAFVAYYSDPEEIAIEEPLPVTEAKVAAAEYELDNAFVKEFNNMVAQLPADGSDVAGIVAARAAYDALSARAKYGIGAYQEAYYDKLVDLEKIVIRHVQGMKITASSTAKKGSITIKWKVKGDAAAADGFQVYRSKKMNSGYGTKAFFKTKDNTKRTYKNTKSLKKGTKYYYKVRAYKVVDGKTYYSDWSNKAYRTAK